MHFRGSFFLEKVSTLDLVTVLGGVELLHELVVLLGDIRLGQTETKYPPFIDIFLNPGRSEEKARIVEHQRNISSQYFSRLSLVYSALFRLLWHSSPPCSPQSGLPSLSLLRSCHLAGRQVDCAQLFTKVPTDTGLCCALNTADILKKSEYGRLVQSLQEVTSTAVQNRAAVAQHF